MKKNQFILIICTLFFVVIAFAYFIFYYNDDVMTRNKWNSMLLFNEDKVKIKKTHYEDLIGLSIDGSVFDYYQYKIENINLEKCSDDCPKFSIMFDTLLLQNIKYSYWSKTPVSKDNDSEEYLSFIIYSSNFHKNKITKDFMKKDLFNVEGNYYCYFGAYPIGTYIFIFSPNDKSMHIIVKK